MSGRVRRPPPDSFRFFLDPLPSSAPAEEVSLAAAAAGGGDEDDGDFPIPSANRAATASPSSVGRSVFSGVGDDAVALTDAAASALVELLLLDFSLATFAWPLP